VGQVLQYEMLRSALKSKTNDASMHVLVVAYCNTFKVARLSAAEDAEHPQPFAAISPCNHRCSKIKWRSTLHAWQTMIAWHLTIQAQGCHNQHMGRTCVCTVECAVPLESRASARTIC
jgi:hypothetical protein